jgi:hypothetical protein
MIPPYNKRERRCKKWRLKRYLRRWWWWWCGGRGGALGYALRLLRPLVLPCRGRLCCRWLVAHGAAELARLNSIGAPSVPTSMPPSPTSMPLVLELRTQLRCGEQMGHRGGAVLAQAATKTPRPAPGARDTSGSLKMTSVARLRFRRGPHMWPAVAYKMQDLDVVLSAEGGRTEAV